MSQIILTEHLNADQANLIESITADKSYFLSGIMMQGGIINGNGRMYDTRELSQIVEDCSSRIKTGDLIMGELEHPETLKINLDRVSHVITEMKMSGDNVIGKMKLINTPSGNITKAILEAGVRLGVSSRGSGNVDGNGKVSGFNFLTVDVVSVPSAPNARPDFIKESLENQKIMTLAEAMVHDEDAQKYLRLEIKRFLRSII
jgi:hypothetical protein